MDTETKHQNVRCATQGWKLGLEPSIHWEKTPVRRVDTREIIGETHRLIGLEPQQNWAMLVYNGTFHGLGQFQKHGVSNPKTLLSIVGHLHLLPLLRLWWFSLKRISRIAVTHRPWLSVGPMIQSY